MSWPPETTPSAAPGPEQPPTAGAFPPPAYYPPPAYPPPAAHNGVPQQSPWGETGLLAPGTFSPPPPAPPRDRLWPPSKREWTTALGLIAGLAAAGAAVAPLWVHLAPRLAFRVDQPGRALPVVPEAEEYVAADGRYVFITLAVGVVAALVCWLLRRTRGPLIMVALAAGGLLGAIVTWRLGLRLGTGYQPSDLQVVGKVLYQPLTLRARAALVVEPVAALIVYLLAVGFSARNDLGREELDRTGPGRHGSGNDGPGRAGEFSSGSG